AVIATDLNGDGKVDLISANQSAGTLSLLTNNGNGGFVLAFSPAVGNSPSSVAAADLAGDRRVDLVSANFGANTRSVPLSKPTFNGNLNGTVAWSSGGALTDSQGGSAELGNSLQSGVTPFLDFHYGAGVAQDYNVRLINDASNRLSLFGNLQVNGTVT